MNKTGTVIPNGESLALRISKAEKAMAEQNDALAENLYKSVLQEDPQQAVAWNGLALVALNAGRADLAIGLAGKAVGLEARGVHHLTLGRALLQQGHLEEARAALHIACVLIPQSGAASFYHAQSLAALKRDAEAEKNFLHALALTPNTPSYFIGLARFLLDKGRIGEAAHYWEKAALLARNNVQIQHEFAVVLSAMGKVDQAADVFAHVATLLPEDGAAQANYGAALFSANRFEKAKTVLQHALDLKPESAEALSNMGLVLMALGELVEALEILERAHELRPDDKKIALNLATILTDMGQFIRAQNLYAHILETSADKQLYAQAQFNLATLKLAAGDLKQGWPLFEARKAMVEPVHMALLPIWQGEAVQGPILVQAEQGLGDFIHFLRYLPYASAKHDLIVEVPTLLWRLVEQSACLSEQLKHACHFIKVGDYQGGAVARTTLLSLPLMLNLFEVPSFKPYLENVLPPKVEDQAPTPQTDKKSIGLVWSGNPHYKFDRRRSIAFDQVWSTFKTLKSISWWALQPVDSKTSLPEDIYRLAEGADMAQTAAIIAQMDLVIAVDTAVAHLAGAMGKPVWLLNRYGGDWRWTPAFQTEKGRSIWYPTMEVVTSHSPCLPAKAWSASLAELHYRLSQWISSVD